MISQLKILAANRYFHANFYHTEPSPTGFGMHGSGMFIINPPYQLKETLEPVLALLYQHLASSDRTPKPRVESGDA
jgi:23S rRNA (adenine2030-N6)-methyltransferase